MINILTNIMTNSSMKKKSLFAWTWNKKSMKKNIITLIENDLYVF